MKGVSKTRVSARKEQISTPARPGPTSLSAGSELTAPLPTANTRPSAFLMASAAAVMLSVPASTTASTLQAAMGVRGITVYSRQLLRVLCARAGSLRTVEGGAKDSTPWRKIILPTCSRLSHTCEESRFTVAVKQAVQQQAPRQM